MLETSLSQLSISIGMFILLTGNCSILSIWTVDYYYVIIGCFELCSIKNYDLILLLGFSGIFRQDIGIYIFLMVSSISEIDSSKNLGANFMTWTEKLPDVKEPYQGMVYIDSSSS